MAGSADGNLVRNGYLFGLFAYLWWGLIPLYFQQVRTVPAPEILAQRIVWSILALAILTTFLKNWSKVRAVLRSRKMVGMLLVSALLLAVNWLFYIYASVNGRIAEASLGYFMLPLVNAFFGVLVLKEQLRPAHYPALALVACAVLVPSIMGGFFPWLAVTLAVSFGLYGLVRKVAPVDSITGLMGETLMMLPVSVGYLLYLQTTGEARFGAEVAQSAWLIASGVVTIVPLVLFALSIKRLPLLAVSFIQFVSPTVQLLLAAYYLGEPLRLEQMIGFGCVWLAVLIFIGDMIRQNRTAANLRSARARADAEAAAQQMVPVTQPGIVFR